MKTSFFTMYSLVFGIGWHVYVRDTKIKQQQTFTSPLTDPPSLHWSPPQHLHQSMPVRHLNMLNTCRGCKAILR
jgi:hypothetical protein